MAKIDPLSNATLQENSTSILITFWEQLQRIKQLTFDAKSKSMEEIGWEGKGRGEVFITKESKNVLVFTEKGSWLNKQGAQVSFSNVFRWTLNRTAKVVSLEHLRHGPQRAVFLFHLTPTSKYTLCSVDSHLCAEDTYFGDWP